VLEINSYSLKSHIVIFINYFVFDNAVKLVFQSNFYIIIYF
jgi:hypothetical protein